MNLATYAGKHGGGVPVCHLCDNDPDITICTECMRTPAERAAIAGEPTCHHKRTQSKFCPHCGEQLR